VVVEVAILGRNHRLLHDVGNLVEVDEDAVAAVGEARDLVATRVVDDARLRERRLGR
jgi:hypothetical protein